ncbi:MAG: LPS export ABC transporter permease LptF [Rhodospirillaceae bacterium]|nr:LPS export ABC transporter permease LptF [Rhodospirillaceae bacterium]
MPTINQYVMRNLVATTAFVTMVLICATWLTQSLRFVELIVNRGMSLEAFGQLTLLLMPSFLTVIGPIALFAAVLFTYNRLTMDSEMIVLRSVGLGPGALARPALILALAAVAAGYALSLYFLPWSYRQFKDLEVSFRSDYSAILLQEGVFTVVTEGVTVYVRSREPDGELRGLLVHDNRVVDRPVTLMAEKGALIADASGLRVIMGNGNRQQFDYGGGRLSLLNFDRYTVDLGRFNKEILNRWREPRERYVHELLFPDDSAGDRFYYDKLQAEGHNRLVMPLYSFAFTLIALAAMLSGKFNRRGQTRRVLGAILAVIVLQGMSMGIQNVAARLPNLIPLMYAGVLTPMLAAFFVLFREPRRRRLPIPVAQA